MPPRAGPARRREGGVRALREIRWRRHPRSSPRSRPGRHPRRAALPRGPRGMARLSAYADASWHAVAPNIDEAQKRLGRGAGGRRRGRQGDSPRTNCRPRVAPRGSARTRWARARRSPTRSTGSRRSWTGRRPQVGRCSPTPTGTSPRPRRRPPARLIRRSPGGSRRPATLLSGARTALAGPKPDVRRGLRAGPRRPHDRDERPRRRATASEQRARDAARLGASITAAQTTLTARVGLHRDPRGRWGRDARTRLAEAQRHLGPGRRRGACRPGGRGPGGRPGDPARECRLPCRRRGLRALRRSVARWRSRRRWCGVGGNIAGRSSAGSSGACSAAAAAAVRGVRRWRLRRRLGRRVVRWWRLRRRRGRPGELVRVKRGRR